MPFRRAPDSARRPRWVWPRRIVRVACWSYLVLAISLWLLLRLEGDRWWVATLVLFGPRWVWAMPLLLLAPAVLLLRRRSLWVLAAGAGVIVWPVMGLCLPSHHLMSGYNAAAPLRVLTCNTHWHTVRIPDMQKLIADARPDIVALQECSVETAQAIFSAGDWCVRMDGELCLASRYPLKKVFDIGRADWPDLYGIAVQYQVQTPTGNIPFINLHLESPHVPIRAAVSGAPDREKQVQDNSRHRLRQVISVAQRARDLGPDVLLAGDFNTTCDSFIFRQNLSGFSDAFSDAGFGFGWTYRVRGTDARIDHILAGTHWRCRRCWVGPDVGSPHVPVIADFRVR